MKKWINAWKYNCPRCRKSPLFTQPFDISKPLEMPYACSTCGQLYEPEPGYYFGAMFISYLISCAILLPIALILNFFTALTVNGIMVVIMLIGAILFLRILRLSRSVWIHIMIGYDPKAVQRFQERKKKAAV